MCAEAGEPYIPPYFWQQHCRRRVCIRSLWNISSASLASSDYYIQLGGQCLSRAVTGGCGDFAVKSNAVATSHLFQFVGRKK